MFYEENNIGNTPPPKKKKLFYFCKHKIKIGVSIDPTAPFKFIGFGFRLFKALYTYTRISAGRLNSNTQLKLYLHGWLGLREFLRAVYKLHDRF